MILEERDIEASSVDTFYEDEEDEVDFKVIKVIINYNFYSEIFFK